MKTVPPVTLHRLQLDIRLTQLTPCKDNKKTESKYCGVDNAAADRVRADAAGLGFHGFTHNRCHPIPHNND